MESQYKFVQYNQTTQMYRLTCFKLYKRPETLFHISVQKFLGNSAFYKVLTMDWWKKEKDMRISHKFIGQVLTSPPTLFLYFYTCAFHNCTFTNIFKNINYYELPFHTSFASVFAFRNILQETCTFWHVMYRVRLYQGVKENKFPKHRLIGWFVVESLWCKLDDKRVYFLIFRKCRCLWHCFSEEQVLYMQLLF